MHGDVAEDADGEEPLRKFVTQTDISATWRTLRAARGKPFRVVMETT
jgi:hypothetical protein